MKKHICKNILHILICIFMFVILFSNIPVYGAETEDDETEHYTIEDIIFNRVPLLDINFFSDTAGGQQVREGSPIDIIRTSVATWYVAFRNLVIVALAIIIIYIGIRMAISTIPQSKAKYKTMLVAWIQAIVIVFVVHMIMILIINTNNGLINILDEALQSRMNEMGWTAEGEVEGSIYDTIKTRAYDVYLSTSIPALIMYIVLIFIKVRFLWVYIKRLITILVLVIIAPFIGAKYAVDATTGKRGTSFSSWLFDFIFNVLIQAVHGIIYIVLISTVVSLAFSSIAGYIIALVVLNFIVSADEIFRNIFEFDKRSSLSSQTAEQRKARKEFLETFEGAVFAGTAVKAAWGFAKGVGGMAVGAGKTVYKEIKRNLPEVDETVKAKLNEIDEKIAEATSKENLAKSNINGGIANDMANIIHYQAKVRILARKKGMAGVKGRKLKKGLTSHIKKRYTANFKLVKDTVTGIGSVFIAIPLTVMDPTYGSAVFTKGYNTLKKTKGKKHYKSVNGKIEKQSDLEYKAQKYTKKRDKFFKSIDLLESISVQENEISDKYKDIAQKVSPDTTKEFKRMQNILLLEASKTRIDTIINDYLDQNKISSIDNSAINDIIDEVADGLNIDIKGDNASKSIIASRAKSKIIFMAEKQRQKDPNKEVKFTNDDIVQAIQESATETQIDKEYRGLSKDLFNLDKKINDFEKKAKTKYRGANKFLENL